MICPSLRQDGTNIVLQKPIGLIKTHYDDDSYTRHIEEALDANASIFVVLSDNTMIDIDTKRDIEVLANIQVQHECRFKICKANYNSMEIAPPKLSAINVLYIHTNIDPSKDSTLNHGH